MENGFTQNLKWNNKPNTVSLYVAIEDAYINMGFIMQTTLLDMTFNKILL